jgi:hypothetical protein
MPAREFRERADESVMGLRYRFIIHNKSEIDELGTVSVRDDPIACEFATKLVQDLIREAPNKHRGCTLEIATGERPVASIPLPSSIRCSNGETFLLRGFSLRSAVGSRGRVAWWHGGAY